MYQKTKFDLPFCGLQMRLFSTGNQSPKYEYSGEASKVKFTCSLTKKKYSLSQVNDWFMTPEVQKYSKAGYVLKYMTKTQEMQNPPQYAKSNLEQIICLVMVKPYKPRNDNVDGLKPISQAMPQHATQFAPDHAQPVDSMSDMDDEIPFLIMVKLSDTQEQLLSDLFNLKKDFAIKLEEIQALYLENKRQSKIIEDLHKENRYLKQQIEKLNQEAEEMLLYP